MVKITIKCGLDKKKKLLDMKDSKFILKDFIKRRKKK